MDIYRPVAGVGGALPVVVFFHGGAWRSGSKSMYAFVGSTLARRGVLVIVPDYRLYPEVRFPGFVEDGAMAIAWAAEHAAEYGGDPHRIMLMGHSAGAHIAAMLALNPAYLAAAGVHERIAGLIGLAGPYDFLPIRDPDVIPVFVGTAPAETQPITYAAAGSPGALLLAGEDDRIVNPRNTTALAARLDEAGARGETKLYPGVGHIGIILAFAPLFAGKAPVLDDVTAFVRSH